MPHSARQSALHSARRGVLHNTLYNMGRTALLCTGLLSAAPSTAHPRLDEAEQLARQNEIAAAADVYRALVDSGVDGAELRYNLGTLALELGQVGEAVLHLRTAQRMAPLDGDVQHNLAVALEARVDRLGGEPVVSPFTALGGEIPPTAARLALAIPLGLLGIACALLGAVPARRQLHFTVRRLAMGLLMASGAGAALYAMRWMREHTPEAVVLVEKTVALREPSAQAQEAFAAHAGLYGDVVDHAEGFVRVRFDNGLEAWLRTSDVGFVAATPSVIWARP